jgi:hypothetical protein
MQCCGQHGNSTINYWLHTCTPHTDYTDASKAEAPPCIACISAQLVDCCSS